MRCSAASRVRARNEVNYLEELHSGDFILNLRSRTLKKRGQPVELTQVEFQIMEYFFHQSRQGTQPDGYPDPGMGRGIFR